MSSNHHSSMITRDNYEELFLLYVDDELTAEQKKAVEAFVQLHPDLKAELDLLCSTKLPAEDVAFENKAELLADSMKVNAVDESLLLYIDNELSETEAANAITPAAGYSSNVIDLAKFASWQFRLLSADKPEILHSSTLKEMQRIQWASTDKKLTWGLGFMIRYDANNMARIGHDGSCPGYVSVVAVDPRKKLGVAVMVNAQGVDIYKYSDQIFNLLNKNITEDTATKNIDLTSYAGRYDNYAWAGETAIVPVKGKLIMMALPTNTPADNIGEFKFIKPDTFRRIRPDDGTLGEELVFQRDGTGKVKSLRIHSRIENKIY